MSFMNEFVTVKTKRSYCILPNARSGKWCIHTSNYQIACCMTRQTLTAGMDTQPLKLCLVFILFIWFCCLYIYCQTCFISIMKNRNVCEFEWYNCQLVWNAFERACFVCTVRRIDVNCIRTSEVWNRNQMKTIGSLEWTTISTFSVQAIKFSCFVYSPGKAFRCL